MTGTANALSLKIQQLPAVTPDRAWHRALMVLVRFRAWMLGSVYTAGSLAIVVRDDGRLLFVRPRYRNGWGLVGGFMKAGEQPTDAMRRELLEEVGLCVPVSDPLGSYVQSGRRHIDHLFLVRVPTDTKVSSARAVEIGGSCWRAPDKLPALHREAIEALTWCIAR